MELNISIAIWQREDWFIAKCPELDFVSQGHTPNEARENLLELIQIQFAEMAEMGTLDEYLAECGYVRNANPLGPKVEMVGFEKRSIQVA